MKEQGNLPVCSVI